MKESQKALGRELSRGTETRFIFTAETRLLPSIRLDNINIQADERDHVFGWS